MNKILFLFIAFVCFSSVHAQKFQKDVRNQLAKEDALNTYNAELISKIDILKALELSGVNIYKFNIGKFDKRYKISLTMDEYINGVKQNSKEIIQGDNRYYYATDSIYTEDTEIFYDYIDLLFFYVKDNDSIVNIVISNYDRDSRVAFSKKKEKRSQFYIWRYYQDTQWKLNEEIPLLIYASSWFDSINNIERFCGVATLSKDDEDTKELLNSSPHYFCFSFKVTEIE